VLVQALGGEQFLGRKSIGTSGGDIVNNITISHPLGTIAEARRMAEIIGDEITKKVRRNRKIR